MSNKNLIILSGSPRGGPHAWNSLFKYVMKPLNADLAICTTTNFIIDNRLLSKAKFKWYLQNYNNFEDYYQENYDGAWKDYFEKGKGFGLYESGMIHFALKDFIYREHIEKVLKYDTIIFTRFDQMYVDYFELNSTNKLLIPAGEDYFGVCDRFIAFDAKYSREYFSIVEYINHKNSLNDYPSFPNCESVFLKQLKYNKLDKKITRFNRSMFTVSLKGEPTNWRVPKYKLLFNKKLMIKYPDEFLDSVKNSLSKPSNFKFKLFSFDLYFTYLYLKFRNYSKIRTRLNQLSK